MASGRPARHRAAAAVLTPVALLLAACASIPTSGPIRGAGASGGGAPEAAVRILPPRPRPGASPGDVVRGFLAAAADFAGDHVIAREYLSAAARRAWSPPSDGTLVYSGAAILKDETTSVVDVTITQTAFVDADGTYGELREPEKSTERFTLRREGGEWRIENPPKILFVATSDLRREFALHDVYFLDPGQDVVVPDVVLLPRRPGLADALVRRLLSGPTAYLAPAVRSAMPKGTVLRSPVTIDQDGVAIVDLSAPAGATAAVDRQALSAQLVWTLRQVPEVRALRLLVEGQPLAVESAALDQRVRDSWPQFDPVVLSPDAVPYVVRSGRLGALRGQQFQPVGGPAGRAPANVRDVAVSIDAATVAWLAGDEVLTAPVDGTSAAVVQHTAPGLHGMSWDRRGVLWVCQRKTNVVWAVGRGRPYPVPVVGARAPVSLVRVSRDGVRAVVVTESVTESGPKTAVSIGLVTATSSGALSITGLRPIQAEPGVRDVAWVDHRRVVLLPAGRAPVVTDVLGFDSAPLPPFPPVAAESITAAAGAGQPAYVEVDGGRLLRADLRGWTSAGAGRYPAYPG